MGKLKKNIYILNFPTPFSADFPRSQDKRMEISKKFLLFPTLFLYTYPGLYYIFFVVSWLEYYLPITIFKEVVQV